MIEVVLETKDFLHFIYFIIKNLLPSRLVLGIQLLLVIPKALKLAKRLLPVATRTVGPLGLVERTAPIVAQHGVCGKCHGRNLLDLPLQLCNLVLVRVGLVFGVERPPVM